ncbi:hypothetical protein G7068_03200 [Leucobacter viscericola]|uniref:Uncharacterized protein n=1 Tax=Leucobacter viscericola TaxID=2714935 RepID=A0A6G7XD72_9MICO|nr:hypothetical protein [Leucobacter viscericola]QIK62321.1 hypothetical protein G7068_03200 [Leucobacter viscericola]
MAAEIAEGIVPARTREARPCEVFGCLETQHAYVDGVMDDEHRSINIGSDAPLNERFLVTGFRNDDSGLWEPFANADLDEISGIEGLALIEQFRLAYRAVQQHCDALNRFPKGRES